MIFARRFARCSRKDAGGFSRLSDSPRLAVVELPHATVGYSDAAVRAAVEEGLRERLANKLRAPKAAVGCKHSLVPYLNVSCWPVAPHFRHLPSVKP
jgi:hypothetical protein